MITMLETESDPGPVLEQLSVSEHNLVCEISVGLGPGHRTEPRESRPWSHGAAISADILLDCLLRLWCL